MDLKSKTISELINIKTALEEQINNQDCCNSVAFDTYHILDAVDVELKMRDDNASG